MTELLLKLTQSEIEMKLLKSSQTLDFQTAKYYHDISNVLTPLEVSVINKVGWIKKDSTLIYKELLTGLISCLDKLLKRTTLDLNAIKRYKIQGNLGTDSTSYKIATAFVEGLKI